ncbi:MAG: hypothetical protein HYS06_08485 [Methylocystis sp.]|nr:hypothetical protein [Methylocystis sp.]
MTHSHTTSAPRTDAPPAAPPSAGGALGADRALATPEHFSLLRLSAIDRVLGASIVVALLWAGVYWALH